MTWLELYKFLHDGANNTNKFEDMSHFWNKKVLIYDKSNGDLHNCDTLIIDEDELVLSIHNEE
jgi:hypothetical protein